MTRPNFNDIQSFDEFKQYYWYRDELNKFVKNTELLIQVLKRN